MPYKATKTRLDPDHRSDATQTSNIIGQAEGQHVSTRLRLLCRRGHCLLCAGKVRERNREQVLTPNICLRSGSLNLKGMLETWSLLGCVLFSVFSDDCVCCWLSVCAESSVCCGGKKGKKSGNIS